MSLSVETLRQVFNKRELTIEDLVTYILAKVYAKVNWRRVARGRDSLDVFQHRVLAASYTNTFSKFLERLCLSLGIQSIRVESDVLEMLNRRSSEVLDLVRHNSIYLVVKAYDLYKKWRELKKVEGVENESKHSSNSYST